MDVSTDNMSVEQVGEDWNSEIQKSWDWNINSGEDEKRKAPDQETCSICYMDAAPLIRRPCCHLQLCKSCLTRYLESKVLEGIVYIQCPDSDCTIRFKEREISSYLVNSSVKKKFQKFLIDSQNDPTLKTCPRCGQERRVQMDVLQSQEVMKHGLRVTCQACSLMWCFPCHAPWHENTTCQKFRQDDQKFIEWTKRRSGESVTQNNAQRCPYCKVYIQRSEGCPNMTCSRCNTRFCYLCGVQFPGVYPRAGFLYAVFFGSHNRRWSPLGCSGSLLPGSPIGRKTIKGLIFGAKAIALITFPLLLLLLIALITILLLLGLAVYSGRHLPDILARYGKNIPRTPVRRTKGTVRRTPHNRHKRQADWCSQTRLT